MSAPAWEKLCAESRPSRCSGCPGCQNIADPKLPSPSQVAWPLSELVTPLAGAQYQAQCRVQVLFWSSNHHQFIFGRPSSQVAWPLSVLVMPLARAQYQALFRLLSEVAATQRDLASAARLHKAARRLPGAHTLKPQALLRRSTSCRQDFLGAIEATVCFWSVQWGRPGCWPPHMAPVVIDPQEQQLVFGLRRAASAVAAADCVRAAMQHAFERLRLYLATGVVAPAADALQVDLRAAKTLEEVTCFGNASQCKPCAVQRSWHFPVHLSRLHAAALRGRLPYHGACHYSFGLQTPSGRHSARQRTGRALRFCRRAPCWPNSKLS